MLIIACLATYLPNSLPIKSFFQCIVMIPCVVHLRCQCHRGRCKILYLFELEMQLLGLDSLVCHLRLGTTGVAVYEIRDLLLVQSVLFVYTVEYLFELPEKLE